MIVISIHYLNYTLIELPFAVSRVVELNSPHKQYIEIDNNIDRVKETQTCV